MTNKVSIIVPVYNSEKTIYKCLDSIINQNYSNIEVILVDDGSIDKSLEICNEYSSKDSRIKVYHKENGGVSSARNYGLEKSTGDYISFVDSDDYIEKNMYGLLAETINKDKSDVAICNVYYENKDGKEIYGFDYINKIFSKIEYPETAYYNSSILGYACNKLYSRNLIFNEKNKYISFDTNITIAEDDLFNYEILNNNKDVRYSYINDKLYHYVLNEEGAINQKFNLNKLTYFDAKEKEIKILEKNNINGDFLKADYVINQVRTMIIMNKLCVESNKKFDDIKKNAIKYKKELKYKNLRLKLLLKFIIATRFPIIYKFKLRNTYN